VLGFPFGGWARPSSMASAFSAARVSQAERLKPWRSALLAAALAAPSSSAMLSFSHS
jgi:hypothetical protein